MDRLQETAERKPRAQFDSELASLLRDLGCNAQENRKAVAIGIVRIWMSRKPERADSTPCLPRLLARWKECAATKDSTSQPKRNYANAVERGEFAASSLPAGFASPIIAEQRFPSHPCCAKSLLPLTALVRRSEH